MIKKNRVKDTLIVGLVQTNSQTLVQPNLAAISALIDQCPHPVDMWVLPEMMNARDSLGNGVKAESLNGQTVQWLKRLAKQTKATIIGGSMMEMSLGKKSYNTTVAVNADGHIMATYRKIHLFDAKVGDASINESSRFLPGHSPVLVSVHGWVMGLSICYDLRFPELYRWYARQGAHVMVVPSSFTTPTGQQHWHVLLRARAIENQCYVLAPNQCGIGGNQIPTYGHTLAVSPLGQVIAQADEFTPQVITVALNYRDVLQCRESMRTWELPNQ